MPPGWIASARRRWRSPRGRFAKSLVPVIDDDGNVVLDHDEYPRPQTTAEGLASLKPAFTGLADYPIDESGTTFGQQIARKFPDLEIEHVHHAGNSSGVVDGAAAVAALIESVCRKARPDAAGTHRRDGEYR